MAAAVHVLVVGAGIAGASAAYFASRAGARVTLIDSGRGTASLVPSALINPVRGVEGKVVPDGFAAARFTFALIDSLIQRGYQIGHGRGLWRPVPDDETRTRWQRQLAQYDAGGALQWRALDSALGLSGAWHSALFLPEAGWVESGALLSALLAESGATRVVAEVDSIDLAGGSLTCSDGTHVKADVMLWCGGAKGAAMAGAGGHTFRPGSVLLLERALCPSALSYGIYAAPCGSKGVVGSTSEPRASVYNEIDNEWAVGRLEKRVAGMWSSVPRISERFRAVRFERHGKALLTTLDGFGSRGYLLAPLFAQQWAKATLAGN